MRILNIVTPSSSTSFFRGIFGYLKQKGFENFVCSNPGEALHKIAQAEGATACEIPMEREISPLRDLVSLWRLVRLMKKIKPTIVNAGTPKAGLLGMLAAWLCRVPVRVFQQRGLRLETTTGFKRKILFCTEKITCFCATRIVCNSESLRQRMIELKLTSENKIIVLRKGSSKGVDPKNFCPNDENLKKAKEIQQRYSIPSDAPVLGFVGRIVNDKGIRELVDAYKKIVVTFPETRLILVGPEEMGDPVDPESLGWLKKNDHVIMAGRCDNVIPYYNLFDLLVFPSYREGFPNVVLEATAMGVPVVGFHVTGVVDAIADGETGALVPMKDSDALADAVLRYLQDKNLRTEHGINARKQVIRDFQPQMLWEAYYQEYCELLRNTNIPAPVPQQELESIQLVDPDDDAKEFAKWYGTREVILKSTAIDEI